MSDEQALRDIARYLNDADRREKAAEQRNKAIVDAITRGFSGLIKEIHESMTRIEHTIADRFPRI